MGWFCGEMKATAFRCIWGDDGSELNFFYSVQFFEFVDVIMVYALSYDYVPFTRTPSLGQDGIDSLSQQCLKSAKTTGVEIIRTFFVNSYILLWPAKRIAAVRTLWTSLLPMPLYSPSTPSSFRMVSKPSREDLYLKALA
jgi:hypothetical protein